MVRGQWWLLLLAVLLYGTVVSAETFGVKKTTPKPDQYGNVVINNLSEQNHIAPVVFNHWLHRALYTCRICHVDLGFAMQAGGTGIKEADNVNGLYCGACHDNKLAFGPEKKTTFGNTEKFCDRCHSQGKKVTFVKDFYVFTKGFPPARFGNKVDWLQAETKGLIKLTDQLPGITIPRKALKIPLDSEIKGKEAGMPDIIFSHQKHAVWNGCELCHPDIFGVTKKSSVYSMQEIFEGKFCGACHGKVAFVNLDCQLCHTKAVF